MNSLLVVISTFIGMTFGQIDYSKIGQLPSLNVDQKTITLSGFSSGGAFSQMFQVSHSSKIHGIASFSHTYYRCGPPTGKIADYDRVCTKLFNLTESEYYDWNKVHEDIRNYHSQGLIDDPKHLQNKSLYIYAGLRNFLFTAGQSLSALKIYERYIKNPHRIMTRVQDTQLLLPTDNGFGKPCTESAVDKVFIGNCGFNGPYEAISFLLGNEQEIRPPSKGRNNNLASQLKIFDQTVFTRGIDTHHMDTIGYYFVPKKCERHNCKLHFYFHGCQTGREFNGTLHILNSGYLEIAEKNDIIMVFPQAMKSHPENDIGCWDTFGISGRFYATKKGAQIIAINKIMEKVTGSGSGFVVSPNRRPGSSGSYGGAYGNNGQNYRYNKEANWNEEE